jgi:2-keto-3-deoxy-L-rhamnonate aldolase
VFNPETDTLELDDQAKYYSYLADSGLTGLVILGTNAETFLLTVSTQAQCQAQCQAQTQAQTQ